MPDLYDIALHAVSHRIPLRDAQRALNRQPMHGEPSGSHDSEPLFDQSPHHHTWNHAEENNHD